MPGALLSARTPAVQLGAKRPLVAGARYGLSCLGCSAGLMVAMAIIGMSNLGWMTILAGVVLVYKLAQAPSTRTWLLSGALIAMAVVYASMA